MLTFDLHVHTVHSGDSPCEVEEAVEAAKKKGLDGIAITDHDSMAGLGEAFELTDNGDLMIIPGIEISSDDGHILGFGIDKPISPGLSALETVSRVREAGGIAISAHPFGLGWKPFSALKADFDAIEVYNPRRLLGNRLAKKYALEEGIPVSAGSDAHFCEEIGLAGVEINMEGSPQVERVLEEIRRGKVSVFGRALPLSGYLRRALFRCSAYR